MCLFQILKGNMDRESVSENVISPPVTARYVRFNPVHWNASGGLPKHDICMRVGVFTCTGELTITTIRIHVITKSLTQILHVSYI